MSTSGMHPTRSPLGLLVFVGCLALRIGVIWAQCVCFMLSVARTGYSFFDLHVPLSVWLSHHTSALGLTLDTLIVLPLITLAALLWRCCRRCRPMQNQTFQTTIRSVSAPIRGSRPEQLPAALG